MGLRRMIYANRKELFVAIILILVFIYDLTNELPMRNQSARSSSSHKVNKVHNKESNSNKEEEKEQDMKGRIIEQFAEDVGNLTLEAQSNRRLIIYNRVPKCGSQTMSMLINHSSRRNKFKSWQLFQNGEVPQRSVSEQRRWAEEVYEELNSLQPKTKPLLFTRHQYYINFADYNLIEPIYINLIRDPVDRFSSFYYFQRFGNARGGGKNQPPGHMSEADWQMSLDECVKKFKRECTSPIWHTIPYLCGNAPVCQEKTVRAVEETKRNIERNYFTIGVLEELRTFLRLLEKTLPQYFEGVLEIYDANSIRNDTHTLNKKTISDVTRKFLAEQTVLQLEYEVYHFIRARFRKQASHHGISLEEL